MKRNWTPGKGLVALLLLAALTPAGAQAAGWSGWARCELNIVGPGYENRETHTWEIRDVTGNTPAMWGTSQWSVSGRGGLDAGNPQSSATHARWSVNANALPGGRFGLITNGGVISIRPFHSQLGQSGGIAGYSQQIVNNSPRTPMTISATAYEWTFPSIEGAANSQTLSGSAPGVPAPGWGYMRASGSTMTAMCSWSLANGSVPASPPSVAPEPVPVPDAPPAPVRSPAEYAWRGSATCDVTVAANGYQDRQIQTWTLSGAAPTPHGGVYVHSATWQIRGDGSSRDMQGKRRVTTSWIANAQQSAKVALFLNPAEGTLNIQPGHPQPLRIRDGITGTQQVTIGSMAQPATPISFDAFELSIPAIKADTMQTRITGTSTPRFPTTVAPRAPADASVTSSCSWDFQRLKR